MLGTASVVFLAALGIWSREVHFAALGAFWAILAALLSRPALIHAGWPSPAIEIAFVPLVLIVGLATSSWWTIRNLRIVPGALFATLGLAIVGIGLDPDTLGFRAIAAIIYPLTALSALLTLSTALRFRSLRNARTS